MDTSKREEVREIEIPSIKQRTINVRIEGTAPLVVHAFEDKAREQIRNKQQGKKNTNTKKNIRKPEAEFEAARYRFTNEHGEEVDGFKAIALKALMIDAGYRYMGLNKVDLRQDMQIQREFLEILSPPPVMVEDVVRLAGIQRPADLRYRPYYEPWEMELPITFKPDRLTETQIVTMLSHGGFGGGIGEWRPSRDGLYGTFKVKSAQEVVG